MYDLFSIVLGGLCALGGEYPFTAQDCITGSGPDLGGGPTRGVVGADYK
jgi:hypothetical protein